MSIHGCFMNHNLVGSMIPKVKEVHSFIPYMYKLWWSEFTLALIRKRPFEIHLHCCAVHSTLHQSPVHLISGSQSSLVEELKDMSFYTRNDIHLSSRIYIWLFLGIMLIVVSDHACGSQFSKWVQVSQTGFSVLEASAIIMTMIPWVSDGIRHPIIHLCY